MPYFYDSGVYTESWTADGSSKTITHNLGTQDVSVAVRRESDNQLLDQSQFNIVATDANSITINPTPGSGDYTAIVQGSLIVSRSSAVSTYAESFTASGGSKVITHSLGTKNVNVTIRRESDDRLLDQSQFDIVTTDANSITFATTPSSGDYTVIVLAA